MHQDGREGGTRPLLREKRRAPVPARQNGPFPKKRGLKWPNKLLTIWHVRRPPGRYSIPLHVRVLPSSVWCSADYLERHTRMALYIPKAQSHRSIPVAWRHQAAHRPWRALTRAAARAGSNARARNKHTTLLLRDRTSARFKFLQV